MEPVKLQSLLIKEVSGVDAPANGLDGWMVMKSAQSNATFKKSLPLGPDIAWDVAAAEERVRKSTGAIDGPNADYASCFLWTDKASADKFGAYKFLVVDVVDGELCVMPQAVKAAAARLPGSSLPETDKKSVEAILSALEKKAGFGNAANAPTEDVPPTLMDRVKDLLLPARKDADDMTTEELKAALDERDEALVAKMAEITKAAPEGTPEVVAATAPVVEAPAPAAVATEAAAITPEVLNKALEDHLAPYAEILEKVLDRIEGTELALGIAARKSLDGQEGGGTAEVPTTKAAPTFGDRLVGLAKAAREGRHGALVGQ